jgi:hypothetical protein
MDALRSVHLTGSVTTINQDVSTGDVRAGIASKENIGTLQLLGLGIASHWDQAMPDVLDLLVNEVGKTGVNVARGNGVDACKVPPLVGERLGEMDAACFSDVVGSLRLSSVSCLLFVQCCERFLSYLFLGIVGNVTRHGGGDDQAAGLAFSEVKTDSPGAVEGSVQVGLDDLVPLLD